MHIFDTITIGAATRDIFVKSKKFEEVPNAVAPEGFDACVPLGSKIDVDELVFATGGGATNAAATMTRFGLKTACICRIGQDDSGKAIQQDLKKASVWPGLVQIDQDRATAHSIILLSGAGHRAILVSRSASEFLAPGQVPWSRISTRWIYLTNVSANFDLLNRVFAWAADTGASIAWNPGNKELRFDKTTLLPFLKKTAVLLLNREEASLLSGQPKNDLRSIIQHLQSFPSRSLVITDGQNGTYAHQQGATWHAPAIRVPLINTTGAGDAFGSAFVASLANGFNLEDALRSGMLNAAGVISHMGAKTGILKKQPGKRALQDVTVSRVSL